MLPLLPIFQFTRRQLFRYFWARRGFAQIPLGSLQHSTESSWFQGEQPGEARNRGKGKGAEREKEWGRQRKGKLMKVAPW